MLPPSAWLALNLGNTLLATNLLARRDVGNLGYLNDTIGIPSSTSTRAPRRGPAASPRRGSGISWAQSVETNPIGLAFDGEEATGHPQGQECGRCPREPAAWIGRQSA